MQLTATEKIFRHLGQQLFYIASGLESSTNPAPIKAMDIVMLVGYTTAQIRLHYGLDTFIIACVYE